ncbi:MAG TPA: LysR substrate-binding domain-containing protein [Burkholderiales bacterium]|nr:LysR substrate-binding domain-containing protein [Burkholderiales bacterium]
MSPIDIHRYLRHGTLPQLRVFEASARLGSFARAADELHMAAPTASVQIRKLTDTLGVPLFEQVGRRIYLTEAGRRLYASCTDVFRVFSELEQTLDGLRGLQAGHLRLAATSTAKYFAPRLLGGFLERHAGVEVSLQIHNRKALIERLENNEDDLYLMSDPPRDKEIIVQAILPNPLVVLARRDHPLAHERAIPFARFAQEPFLMREPGSGTRMAALRQFEQRSLVPRIRMELSTNEAIREAIMAGLGVSILSRYTLGLERESSDLVCLDVEGFPLESYWHFVYPVGKQLCAAAQAFMKYTRIEAKTLAQASFGVANEAVERA